MCVNANRLSWKFRIMRPQIIDTLRTATEPDAASIAQLVNETYRPQSGNAGWTHEAHLVSGNRTSAEQVAEAISKPDSVILAGIKDSKIVACIHVAKNGDDSHIGLFAVDPALQGAGAGKQLLDHAESYAAAHFNAKRLVMLVLSARNDLLSFFLRRGYLQTGDAIDYPSTAGVGIPMHANLKVELLNKSI